ncbi:UDP-glucuronosyl/UDP-glucosyltransferase [Dillenia turbinata]|uniref:Glycosyltransferase n=1 Tax=Dillenia turbinata TaxID=194707 RepID=A0AAN8UMR9_9MAGN
MPIIGHIVPMVELAKLLLERHPHISITLLLLKLPYDSSVDSHTNSLSHSLVTPRIRLVHLPPQSLQPPQSLTFFANFLQLHKLLVRDVLAELTRSDSIRLAAFVADMACSAVNDVTDQFGVPLYVFFTCGAVCADILLHMQRLHDEEGVDFLGELSDSGGELKLASMANPVPARVWPALATVKDAARTMLFADVLRTRKSKGIIINTFEELESRALQCFYNVAIESPPVYPVGPLLNLNGRAGDADQSHEYEDIMGWLEGQPPSSVVFLCFGSMGSFDEDQVREIARGLERSRQRFLWSLRRPPMKDLLATARGPTNYENLEGVLPEGFVDRTAEIGKITGWAPQLDVLAHKAVGGFVSHCGWNSILESIWHGVPIATWPLYSEQQLNAFELVRELGLATEIRVDYRKDYLIDANNTNDLVTAEEIRRAVESLMEQENEVRRKVKRMSEVCRKAVVDSGSSYSSLGRLIDDIFQNLP